MACAMCEVTGYGDDGDGVDILFYKLPDGEEVYGAVAVEEVRALVLAQRAANKRQRRGN